jgi:hypothetical protein
MSILDDAIYHAESGCYSMSDSVFRPNGWLRSTLDIFRGGFLLHFLRTRQKREREMVTQLHVSKLISDSIPSHVEYGEQRGAHFKQAKTRFANERYS